MAFSLSFNPLDYKPNLNSPIQCKASSDQTGLPISLKQKAENISGFSMDDVRVHYNSSSPSKVNALAYTQGSQIYIGPGQEKHLSHELGHVIQQKQGRVSANLNYNGFNINNDKHLEHEADVLLR